MPDNSNMSIRRFLKEVGVSSQRAMEDALRDGETAGRTFEVRMVLTVPELGLNHEVTGAIEGRGAADGAPGRDG
ncbi:MAG: DUF6494 family protein [Pseudomonadota bacterium]